MGHLLFQRRLGTEALFAKEGGSSALALETGDFL
jgi:hypothetical protein